jgi:hypothetical protein
MPMAMTTPFTLCLLKNLAPMLTIQPFLNFCEKGGEYVPLSILSPLLLLCLLTFFLNHNV